MDQAKGWRWVAPAALLAALLAGCGTPGAPLPPSLNLPDPVTDLAAARAGDQVSLTWTTPQKNTDKLIMKDDVSVWICRKEGSAACEDAGGGNLRLAPGSAGSFKETLPPALTEGAPRTLTYVVELKNRNGKSAGASNAAVVLAGASPAPLTGFSAEVRKAGVVLRWTADNEDTAVRLQRKLLTPQPAKPKQEGLLAPPAEPLEQNLLVEGGSRSGNALDKDVRFGETYEYRAQRVSRVTADGKTLELDSALSQPVQVEVRDVFPPTVPRGLVAVAIAGVNGAEPAIDLSWQPDSEADIAGYVVYRRQGDGPWQRVSATEPLVGPAFHDAHVEPGGTYHYAVSAVDQGGHESARSTEAQETVPER
jgi:hypothetical protein